MAEGCKLTEEDCATASLNRMKIDITQEEEAISHPAPTTIDLILLEILDIIIEKSCVLFILRTNRARESENDVLKQLASVSHYWFKRITKRRFNNAVWSYLSNADRLNMIYQKDRLIELIESEFGLLDKLLRSGALTRVKMAKVKTGRTVFEKNELLLNFIFSENKHQDLMKALSDCGQHHIVNWVRGNGEYKEEYGSDWPLRETEVTILDNNQQALVDCLRASEILPILYTMQEINERQRESIDSERTEYKKTEALLEIVRRFCLRSYSVFIKCIRMSGQSHVADMLEHDGFIVPVHARLECEYLDEVETQIVNKMENVLMGNASMQQADRLLAALELRVIAMRRGKSIVIYTACNKEEEFDHLCKIIDNLKMRNILEELFNLLIPNAKIKVLLATILSKDIEKAKKTLKEIKRKNMNTKDNDQLYDNEDKDPEEERWKMAFDRHHDFIVDRMSPDFGLIDKLYSNFSITEDNKDKIKANRAVRIRNENLIKCLKRKLDLGKLIQVLRESGQKHLVNYLESDGNYSDEFDGEWPLTEKEISVIKSNYESLIDLVDMSDLLNPLYATGVINTRQREFISSKATSYEKNEALLEILRTGSLHSYWQTIRCLHQSKQSHIAEILEMGGVIVPLHSTLECENLDEVETQIVNQMADKLMRKSSMEADRLIASLQLKVIALRRGK